MSGSLSVNLLERVLERFDFSRCPDPTLENLRLLYAAWCHRVPFDNVRKLIHIHRGESSPFPGSTAEDFFAAWLKHGTGGTCWAGAGAFQVLLQSLGFDAVRGIGTMLVAPDLPPNHGTVCVSFGLENYLVDCSILHGEPLHLDGDIQTVVDHPAWGVRCSRRDGKWHVAWRPLHKLDGLECRLESFDVSQQEYQDRYEKTRPWSPFNYELVVRLNKEDCVVGAGFGKKVKLKSDGSADSHPIFDAERRQLLIEETGLSEEIVSQLPPDHPTPPPPWSKTAAAAS